MSFQTSRGQKNITSPIFIYIFISFFIDLSAKEITRPKFI